MKWIWWGLFIVGDVVIATAMIALLCSRQRALPRKVEWLFPLKGKWLWYFLLTAVILCYAALAPVGLLALVRILKSS
jgi:hypothetical protein